ncbi:hypothetical protein RPD_1744 [Rhodopseudomonas palustris BisB5]|uniref:UrcA family protein n=1 Tax=Rhodopseudomonas palustris (strain BisB5) TaxID=316057 RepID=Q13AA9_RHOPS|nr:hypothetical protein RPD_1744 [Rhodopseudomonas palustris BisB5]
MSPLNYLAVVSACVLLIGPATAQGIAQTSPSQNQDSPVRVQTSVTLFHAGPVGVGEQAQKLFDQARRVVYEMASRECDLLRATIAKDCRLESVNSNIRQSDLRQQQQQDGYHVTGSIALTITLK